MTNEELEAIAQRAEKATPGPWGEVAESGEWWLSGPNIYDDAVMSTNNTEISQADVDFIAAARTDVPALVAEVRGLRGELEAATAHIDAVPVDELRRYVEHAYVADAISDGRYDLGTAWSDHSAIRYWLDGNEDDGIPPAGRGIGPADVRDADARKQFIAALMAQLAAMTARAEAAEADRAAVHAANETLNRERRALLERAEAAAQQWVVARTQLESVHDYVIYYMDAWEIFEQDSDGPEPLDFAEWLAQQSEVQLRGAPTAAFDAGDFEVDESEVQQ